MTSLSATAFSINRQRLLRSTLLLLILVASITDAFALRRERTNESWYPVHYAVDITLNDDLSEIISARTELTITITRQTSSIDLDFGDLTVGSVQLNGRGATFTHKSGVLQVTSPEPLQAGNRITLTVTYHGRPKDGLILSRDKDGKPSVIGDNWPDRVHHWIPSLDHPSAKATVTFNVTAPAKDLVVANGKLDGVATTANGNRTWTYTESVPIPPYCMIIAVGDFAQLPSLAPSVTPLTYYVPQSDKAYAQTGFAPAAPSVELFSRIVAPYPYEKLALIVGATRFGGMENSSAIVFTATLFNRNSTGKLSRTFGIPSGTVSLVAHEIAHQWFGDSVTESTWSDLWLSEGFATYFAGLFIQKHDGDEVFRAYMQQAAEAVFTYEKKNSIPIFDPETEDLMKLLNANNYQKGAWVLHMLRMRLGDEVFFKGIRSYYEKHKNSTAATDDLRAALEKASGKNLREFFARWVFESGHPKYDLTWSWDSKRRQVKLTLRQTQSSRAFVDPVEVLLHGGDSVRVPKTVILEPSSKETFMSVSFSERPTRVEIDPRGVILKEVGQIRGADAATPGGRMQ